MQASGLESYKNVAYFEYDFGKHGGAVGDISVGGDALPAGAIITGGLVHVKTAFVGATATMAVKALSSEDILAATAVASLTLNALFAVVPVPQTSNTWIRLTSNLTALTFTVATAAFTAGKAVAALEYLITTE